MRIRTVVLASAAAAGALVVAFPFAPLASAASGSFTYVAGDGKSRTSTAIGDGTCVALKGSGPVRNKTDSDLELFSTPKCDKGTDFDMVSSGESKDVPSFQGIRWVAPQDDEGGDD